MTRPSIKGKTDPPIDPKMIEPDVLAGLMDGVLQPDQRSVLLDERVEAFVWPAGQEGKTMDQKYYAFEVNYGGVAITNHAQFDKRFDFTWGSPESYTATTYQLAVGWGGTSSPVPSAEGKSIESFSFFLFPFPHSFII